MSSRNHCRVRAATRGDIPAMTRIRYRAFGSSTFHTRLWPEHLRVLPNKGDDQQAWLAQRTKKHFDEGNETIHYIVAVQDLPSGEEVIVGSGEWIKPAGNDDDDDDDDKTGGKEPETDRSLVTQEAELPSALDKGVLEERAEGAKILQEAAERVLGKENMKNMWLPNSIAVDPDHQGKGIGTMLALWGVEQAMKEGRDVYLLASSAGALLYKKLGFTEIYGTEIMGERQFAMAKTRTPIVVQSAEP